MSMVDTATGTLALPADDSFSWQGFDIAVGVERDAIKAEWHALEAANTASLFQSHAFVDAWCRKSAAGQDETPLFAVGRQNGALRFVLPLALGRQAGLSILGWLSSSHANYGMALIHPDAFARFEPAAAEALMVEIAHRAGAAVVHLENQPLKWAGRENPFAVGASARLSANDTYVFSLEQDFDAQYRRLYSGRSVSTLRRKQKKLEDSGAVCFDPPAGPEEKRRAIDWFIAEKHRRLAAEGQESPFDRPEVAELYRELAVNSSDFEIDQITLNGALIAVTMTMYAGDTAYLLNTAYSEGEHTRHSPGALILHRIVRRAHGKGMRRFDFGPGALPYKFEWEPETTALVTSTMAASALGRPLQLLYGLAVSTKAMVKRNDQLRDMAFTMRRIAALGFRGGGASNAKDA